MYPEIGLFNPDPRPRVRNQLLLADQRSRTNHQRSQYIERATAEPDGLSILQQDTLFGKKTKWPKGKCTARQGFYLEKGEFVSSISMDRKGLRRRSRVLYNHLYLFICRWVVKRAICQPAKQQTRRQMRRRATPCATRIFAKDQDCNHNHHWSL
jgi:hypothetical protein